MPRQKSVLHAVWMDLRRRHVVRVVAAYSIVAWFVVQIADVVLPALLVPSWVFSALVALALAGLPVVAVTTWIYDLTPRGLVRTPPARGGAQPVVRWNWRWIDYVLIAGLVSILAFVLLRGPVPQPAIGRTIAVLPFEDISPHGDNRFFSEGLAEALIDALAGVPELRVMSRTSSFAFRGRTLSIEELAGKLQVESLLEGSVRRDGDELRVNVRLIDGRNGHSLWSDSYQGSLEDVFDVQDRISRTIAGKMRIQLTPGSALVEVPTTDQDAYDDYLRGRERLRAEGTPESFSHAIAHFQRAVERDPGFALAYAGLCTAYWGQYRIVRDPGHAQSAIEACDHARQRDDGRAETLIALGNLYFGTGRPREGRRALEHALELQPNSAEAHTGMGDLLLEVREPEAAERYLLRAVELDPAYWRPHYLLGVALYEQRRNDEAVSRIEHAIRLEPDSPDPYASLGGMYLVWGQYQNAESLLRQSIERFPNAWAYANAGSAYFYLGDYAQAEAMYREAVAHSPADYSYHAFLADAVSLRGNADPEEAAGKFRIAIDLARQRLEINPADQLAKAYLARFLARTGRTDEAGTLLESLMQEGRLDMDTQRNMAMAQLLLGRPDTAIELLTAAVAQGYPLVLLRDDPRLRPLLEEPAFQALIRSAADP